MRTNHRSYFTFNLETLFFELRMGNLLFVRKSIYEWTKWIVLLISHNEGHQSPLLNTIFDQNCWLSWMMFKTLLVILDEFRIIDMVFVRDLHCDHEYCSGQNLGISLLIISVPVTVDITSASVWVYMSGCVCVCICRHYVASLTGHCWVLLINFIQFEPGFELLAGTPLATNREKCSTKIRIWKQMPPYINGITQIPIEYIKIFWRSPMKIQFWLIFELAIWLVKLF